MLSLKQEKVLRTLDNVSLILSVMAMLILSYLVLVVKNEMVYAFIFLDFISLLFLIDSLHQVFQNKRQLINNRL